MHIPGQPLTLCVYMWCVVCTSLAVAKPVDVFVGARVDVNL